MSSSINKGLEISLKNKIKLDIYSDAENNLFIDMLIAQNNSYKEKVEEFMGYLNDISEYITLDGTINKIIDTDDKKEIFRESINSELSEFTKGIINNKDNVFEKVEGDEREYFEKKFNESEKFNYIKKSNKVEEDCKENFEIKIKDEIYFQKLKVDRYIIPILFLNNKSVNENNLDKDKEYYLKCFYFDKTKIEERKGKVKTILDKFILNNEGFILRQLSNEDGNQGLLNKVSYISNYKIFTQEDFDETRSSLNNEKKIQIIDNSYKSYLENTDIDFDNIIKNSLKKLDKYNFGEITLEEYCIGQENKDNFSYKLEFDEYLSKLGSIRGATSSKYGVYFSKKNSKYRFTEIFNKDGKVNEENAIKNIRKILLSVKNAKDLDNLYKIEKEGYISSLVLRKIFYLYNIDEMIPIYTDEKMEEVFNDMGLEFINYEKAQDKLLKIYKDIKNKNKDKDNISTLSFMYFLVHAI